MVRPKKNRMVAFDPDVSYFKPRGIPLRNLEEVNLTVDELEAIRLSDGLGLSQEEAGRRMEVSRATFGRIIQNARQLIADALVNGKAIRIEGGTYRISKNKLQLMCSNCDHIWETASQADDDTGCPKCRHKNKQFKKDQET